MPSFYSDQLRITASPQYLSEIDNLSIQEGDIIISSFTSSPAFIASIFPKNNLKKNVNIISGYNFWGEDYETISLVKNLYKSKNEFELKNNFCVLNAYYKNYLYTLPESEEFLVVSLEDRKELIENLNNPKRILLAYSLFDINNRKFDNEGDSEKISWWKLRSLSDINYNSLSNLNNIDIYYQSNNLILLSLNIENCSPTNPPTNTK